MRTSAARTNQSAALLRMIGHQRRLFERTGQRREMGHAAPDFAAVFERVDDEVPFAEDVLERG